MNEVQYLTPEGLKNLENRLKYLTEVRRVEVAERLRHALEEGGDLSENAEYEDAKNEQAFVEGEILRLESILSTAQIIEATGNKDVVALGAVVTVVEKGTKEQEVYHLVGSAEANPREGKISSESPLGKALMGAKVGDQVVVNAPDGQITFIIKAIA
ncbi:MAG: transcription elongation factor GreA [Chloroflexi bacterium]|nr:transcription elongation factor GreA [Chloroflexota bacterium]MDL1884386.1 transcription elongation factor GreA [Anaerolineae bacterium CFX8]GIL13754.1 MAG: transcription elongation factor GreA [Chloroflexota bacterium]